MAHICQVHPYEVAEGLCRSCGGPFCADCLVYPFGPVKPPYCVPCAVSAAGVRTSARNPTVAVPKETKRRLKEWRKARKRDLESPPPDGVATWQKMDEAAVADEEDTAAAQAAAEREALRLPPPKPETPTPPPGINLAPPGPPGSDWRDEIAIPTTDDAVTGRGPASGEPDAVPPTIAGESALGAGWTGGDPGPPTEADRLPQTAAPLPADDPYGAAPPVPEPRPYTEPEDASSSFPAIPTDDPSPFAEAFEPTAFEPTPFEPTPDTAPFTVELASDPLASFGLRGRDLADPPPPPPADGGQAFEPLAPPHPTPHADAVTTLPSPTTPSGQPDLAPPAPLVPPPPEPLVAPHTRATAAPGTPRLTPPPTPTRLVAPDVPRSAIRPPTPTRIPAAEPEAPRANDAKAMLARIAALRSDKKDPRPPA